MLRNFCISVFGLLLLVSCQTVDLSEYLGEQEEGYELTFTIGKYPITDFDDAVTSAKGDTKAPLKSEYKEAGALGTVVNLIVFRGEEKVKTVNQKAGDENFGKVKVSLAEGIYKVVAIVHNGSGNATGTSPEKISFPSNKVTDTFACCTEIDVTKDENIEIQLERVVSKFRFTVEDAIPSEVSTMQFYYTGGSSTLDAESGFGCVNSRQTEIREVKSHEAGQVFEVYTFPHDKSGELTMTITALDASGGEYAVQTLKEIPVEYQKVTNCSMVFFGNSSSAQGSQSFTLTGDAEWKGEINY